MYVCGIECVVAYQSGPQDGGATGRGEGVHSIGPHHTVLHQEQVEEAFLVDADPLSPVPLHTVIFHQHLQPSACH